MNRYRITLCLSLLSCLAASAAEQPAAALTLVIAREKLQGWRQQLQGFKERLAGQPIAQPEELEQTFQTIGNVEALANQIAQLKAVVADPTIDKSTPENMQEYETFKNNVASAEQQFLNDFPKREAGIKEMAKQVAIIATCRVTRKGIEQMRLQDEHKQGQ